jgi:hypothetical protein
MAWSRRSNASAPSYGTLGGEFKSRSWTRSWLAVGRAWLCQSCSLRRWKWPTLCGSLSLGRQKSSIWLDCRNSATSLMIRASTFDTLPQAPCSSDALSHTTREA